ncbi:MAG: hypothetical protein IAG10_27480, partial [Planctomycetaceae bacterium]|nr:hypothetical protein [Planctomycetaceae bacterium]
MKAFRLGVCLLLSLLFCGVHIGCQEFKLLSSKMLRSQSPDKSDEEVEKLSDIEKEEKEN